MATLYKRDGSPYWWIRFQHDGKRYQESTGETNEAKARKQLRERKDVLRGSNSVDDLFRRLCAALDDVPVKDAVVLRQEYAAKLMNQTGSKVSISDAWQVWVDSPKKGNPGSITLKDYAGVWNRFSTWAEEQGIKNLHEVNAVHAEKYASDLLKSGIAARTYNKSLTFIRSVWAALKVPASLTGNPWLDIPVKQKDAASRRMFEPDELSMICRTADGWLRNLFALGIYTGMRLHDCACLKWNEVDMVAGMISRKTSKRKKAVRIPIHPALLRLLGEIERSGEYVLPDAAGLYEKDTASITKRVQNHILQCGIDVHAEGTGQRIRRDAGGNPVRGKDGCIVLDKQKKRAVVDVGFHSFRHSFVSLCAANHIPQSVIQELVGHGSPAVTAIYTHASDETRRAIAELPEVV